MSVISSLPRPVTLLKLNVKKNLPSYHADFCVLENHYKVLISFFLLFFSCAQILLIFLQKMDLLLTKTPSEDIKNSVLPMVYRALEAPSTQIQVVMQ